jgi:hypothetical protein
MVRRSPSFVATLLAVTLILSVAGVPAAAAQDLLGSRAVAMGGALRAAPSGETAVLLNPAGLTLNKNYILHGSYSYRGSDSASILTASVVDSVTKKLAAGLYYAYIHASPSRTLPIKGGKVFTLEETIDTHEAGLALAYPLGQILHLGVTTKYVNLTREQPEDTPEAALADGANGVTMDIGVILRVIPQLNLAATFHNAIPIDHESYARSLGLGVSYAFGTMFLAEFNTVLDFDRAEEIKPSYHGGLELFLGGKYALRGGVMHDTFREATYASGGVGFMTNKIGLDFGLRQMVDGGAETLIAFSVRLFVQ